MYSGSRREIEREVGLRFGKIAFLALDQSKYSVESWVFQNLASSSSLLNLGIFLSFFAIFNPFFFIRAARGNYSNFQKSLKNCSGLIMGILWNLFKASSSLSPVTTHCAFADWAAAKI